tara:strand:+ start:365 stop:736 length:372 start_codon:yes stop_codon:yes gene_type:complete
MKTKAQHLEVGKAGEFLAMVFLKKKGLRLLNMNWRWHRLEVDLIMKEKDTLVFVEVKTRSNSGNILPEDAVNHKKMQNLIKAAEQYILKYRLDCEVRFDIVSISNFPRRPEIMHFEDAFYSYN